MLTNEDEEKCSGRVREISLVYIDIIWVSFELGRVVLAFRTTRFRVPVKGYDVGLWQDHCIGGASRTHWKRGEIPQIKMYNARLDYTSDI